MRAAIIGAGGFLGRALGNQLHDRGWEVLGYDVAAPQPPLPGVRFATLDILREEVPLPQGIEAVYYLAQSPALPRLPQGGR